MGTVNAEPASGRLSADAPKTASMHAMLLDGVLERRGRHFRAVEHRPREQIALDGVLVAGLDVTSRSARTGRPVSIEIRHGDRAAR